MKFHRQPLTLAIATAGALLLGGCGNDTVGTGTLGAASVTCATVTGCSGGTAAIASGSVACQTATGCSGTGTGTTGAWTFDDDDREEQEDDGGTAATLSVTPSLGMTFRATVHLYDASLRLIGTADTGDTGTAWLNAADGPVVVEVSGDDDAMYFDEAANTLLAFNHGALHAALPRGSRVAGVTTLTEIAWQLLAHSGAPINDANVIAANEAVRAALAPGLPDILTPPTPWSASVAAGSLGTRAADQYALLLAGLAHLGSGGAPALEMLTQLGADLQDGRLDAVAPAGAGVALSYASTATLDTALQQRLDALSLLYGDAALQALVATQSGTAHFAITPPVLATVSPDTP